MISLKKYLEMEIHEAATTKVDPAELQAALLESYRSALLAMGKSGARSPGPSGWSVPGCNGGAKGLGRSGMMLYQTCGMWLCGRMYWMVSIRNILHGRMRMGRRGIARRRAGALWCSSQPQPKTCS